MNKLIEQFGNDKRWVNWKFQERKGKKTKVPYDINGKLASSVDPKSWSTYKEAKKASENIGIVFTPVQDLLGIDIDHCLKNNIVDHEQKDQIESLLREANTYTEISPSGEGLHLFLKVPKGLKLESNKKAPFEAYTSGRYFTFTASPFNEELDVREVSTEEAIRLLNIIGYPWKDVNEPATFVSSTNEDVNKHENLSDSEILEKMFASKNGAKIKEVYDTVKGNSEDDMSFCSHLAFWTRKDPIQMERIWLNSPLGSRRKTKLRKDYRDRTIATAIKNCKDVYEVSPAVKTKAIINKFDLDLLFSIDAKGNKFYLQNTENICRILRKYPDFVGRLRYDIFKNTIEVRTGSGWRNVEEFDAITFQTDIQIIFSQFGLVGKNMVYDAMIKVAKENTVDTASDYIKSIKWDGQNRLESWLSSVYGVEESLYHKAVGSNWIKGMVKRIIEPGCKFDYVLVLEGEQGTKKSTSLHILGGNWHVETTMSTDSKDFFMQFSGKAIIEFSEGETLSRTEVKRMKAIITMQSDKYRPPYERTSQDFPRRCVFAMTTNQEQYLKDETGNRRWLPVKVILAESNIKWLEENRDQLFAEAYHRVFELNETIYEFPKEETLAAQNARRILDSNTDLIADWYYNKLDEDNRELGITIHQVYRDALHGSYATKPMTKFDEMNIAGVLRHLGLIKRQRVQNKTRLTRWYRQEDLATLDENFDIAPALKAKEEDF